MTGHDARPEQLERAEDAGHPDSSAVLPSWVLRCWPASWRRSYGDEMADTWADCGGTRLGMIRLAGQGLWQRVVRPRTAAGIADGERHHAPASTLTAGGDLTLIAGPRMLLRTLTAMATILVVTAAEILLFVAIDVFAGSPVGNDSTSAGLIRQQGVLVATTMVVPLATAAYGERLTRRRATRDQGIGVVLGALGLIWPAMTVFALTLAIRW